MDIVFLIVGLLAGALVGFFFAKMKFSGGATALEEKARSSESRLLELSQNLRAKEEEVLALSKEIATKDADYKNISERLKEQKLEVTELNKKFTIEFENLANKILEEKSKKFTDQNKSNISDILSPLKEKIIEFEKKVEESNRESTKQNSALVQQIIGLKELNQQITKEAENLTKALKGDNKAQGNWGELILEKILEKSGLQKGREYEVQKSYESDEGKRYQPDVVINLPEDKHVIVDSKVSLVAYEKYVNASDEEEKQAHLKNHILSIRTHVKGLSEKSYQDLYGIQGLDFILLFMPIEPAFGLAVQNEDNLFTDAYEKNIVLVGPSTLIATLRTIASIWRQEYQNQNVEEIARQAGALYDKFVGFSEDLVNLGKKINDTQDYYKQSMNKIIEGKGSLVSRVENIRKLGVKTKKELPQQLIKRLDEGEE